MATLTVKNLTTASGQDLALRTGGTDRLTISSSDGSVTIGGGLALGPSPASSGYLRIPNNQSITARNAANTGNVNLIGLNSSDQVVFGTGLSLGDQSITNVYSISQTTSSNWNISNAGAATFAGNLNLTGAGAQLYVGNTNTSTQSCLIQIGNGRTGSGQSYIDFVGDTTYTDFGMRLARDGGANGSSYIQHRGTGDLALLGQDASAISLRTNNTERFRINSDGTACLNTSNTVSNAAQTIVIRSGETINTALLGRSYGGSCSLGLQAAGGTEASPSATTTSTNPVNIVAGTTSNGTTFVNSASINIGVESTPTATSHPTFFAISTTPSASTTRVERFRINSSGSVGIGTSSPVTSLHIDTSSNLMSAGDPALLVSGSGNKERIAARHYGNGDPGFLGERYMGTVESPTTVTVDQSLAFFGGRGYNGTGLAGTSGLFGVRAAETFTTTAQGTYLAFETTSIGSTTRLTRMVISSSGNVGIGTINPSNTLDVVKNADSANSIFVTNDNTGSSAISSIRLRTGGTGASIASVEHYGVNSVGGERMRITAGSAGPMIFTTGNLERIRILSGGDVGIGTTGPTAKLSVVSTGQVHIGNTTQGLHTGTNNSGAIYFGNSADVPATTTAGIETSWGNASMPQIHIGVTRDGNKTRIGCFYDQTVRFYTGNVERAIFHPAGHFYPSTDNAYTCGASGQRWASLWAANGTIQTSDQREKNTITDSVLGLNFIQSLRPVSYKWNVGGNEVELERDSNGNTIPGSDGADKTITTSKPGTRTHWGLIAQEVKAAVDATGVDFGGWVLSDKDDPDSQQALRYDQFIAPLIKAVQELSAKVEELEARLPQN